MSDEITKFWTFAPETITISATNPIGAATVTGSFYYIEITPPGPRGGDPDMTVQNPLGTNLNLTIPASFFGSKLVKDISGQDVMNRLQQLFGATPYQHVPPAPKDVDRVLHHVPPSKRSALLDKLYPNRSKPSSE